MAALVDSANEIEVPQSGEVMAPSAPLIKLAHGAADALVTQTEPMLQQQPESTLTKKHLFLLSLAVVGAFVSALDEQQAALVVNVLVCAYPSSVALTAFAHAYGSGSHSAAKLPRWLAAWWLVFGACAVIDCAVPGSLPLNIYLVPVPDPGLGLPPGGQTRRAAEPADGPRLDARARAKTRPQSFKVQVEVEDASNAQSRHSTRSEHHRGHAHGHPCKSSRCRRRARLQQASSTEAQALAAGYSSAAPQSTVATAKTDYSAKQLMTARDGLKTAVYSRDLNDLDTAKFDRSSVQNVHSVTTARDGLATAVHSHALDLQTAKPDYSFQSMRSVTTGRDNLSTAASKTLAPQCSATSTAFDGCTTAAQRGSAEYTAVEGVSTAAQLQERSAMKLATAVEPHANSGMHTAVESLSNMSVHTAIGVEDKQLSVSAE